MDSFRQVKYIILLLLIPFLIWGLWGSYYQRGNFTLAHDLYEESYQLNILQIFANNLEVDTKKEIHIQSENVNKHLRPTSEIKKAVQEGQYAFGSLYLEHLRKMDPVFEVDSMPFLATNYRQARVLWDLTRSQIIEHLKKSNLVYLFSIPCSPQDLYLNKKMKSLSSIRILKVRAYGEIVPEYLSLLGVTPVLFRGVKELHKVRDGHMDGFFGGRNSAYFVETSVFASYCYRLKYSLPKYVVVMNAQEFEQLSPKNQKKLLVQSGKMEKIAWRISQTDDQRRQHFFKALPIPEWFKDLSLKASKTILTDWKIRSGKRGQRLLAEYEKRLKELNIPLPPILGGPMHV
jgi:TRAP-type C4-dicarboxylate transport system substrate-binding protein